MADLLSKKVKTKGYSEVSEDRYEYLSLNEAEPNLSAPEFAAGPLQDYVLASDEQGNRYWVLIEQGGQGTQGIQGLQGLQGFQGIQGFGIQGLQGIQGIGNQGVQGLQGVQGDFGVQGIAGQSVRVIGSLGLSSGNEQTELNAAFVPPAISGDGVIDENSGYLWVYNGVDLWTNVGLVKGPQGTQGTFGPQGIQGPQGTQGIQGDLGIQGDIGLQGTDGSQGILGIQGFEGLQGSFGIQGNQGVQGVQGPQGTQGTQGIQGDLGRQGVQGRFGPQGIQGNTGTQGLQGIQGDFGLQGIQGTANQGIQGNSGAQGRQGVQGSLGLQGIQGAGGQGTQGIQGPQGTQGIQGDLGFQGVQGPQGPQGVQGIQGPQGTQGVQGDLGFQGVQGPQGPQGIQGDQGIQGIQGPQGIQGILGRQGLQGIQGVQGLQGVQGFFGVQGFRGLQGIQGIQGVQGPQGIQGIQGIQGQRGRDLIIIGSVPDANINNPPTSPEDYIDAAFPTADFNTGILDEFTGDLYIKQDDGSWLNVGSLKGNQGIQGPQGTQGLQGPQGTQGLQGRQGVQGQQGNKGGLPFTFSTITTMAAVPDGVIRYNNTTFNLITQVTFDAQTLDGVDVRNYINTWDDNNTALDRGTLIIKSMLNNDSTYSIFRVTGNVTDNTTYLVLNVTPLSGNIPDLNEDLVVEFIPTGFQGTQGIQGPQGTQGIQGPQGTQGVQGPQGTQGIQGDQGIQGIQGPQGTQGIQGDLGFQGVQGPQGTQGIQGDQGIQGIQGPQGTQGLQGPQGTQGIQGVQGTIGSALVIIGTVTNVNGIYSTGGPNDPQGYLNYYWGPFGISGVANFNEAVIDGFTGDLWVYGSDGTWDNVGNIRGLQGLQGLQGPQGVQGIQGPQGTQGIQGDQGIQGIQGPQGTQGLQGPQGTQGIQGVQGPQSSQGTQGVQGKDGNFGGATFDYTFSTSTDTTVDPGSGLLRLNSSTFSSATQLAIDDVDDNASDIQSFLSTIDTSTSLIKGQFRISKKTDPTNFIFYSINELTEGTNFWQIDCSYLVGSGPAFSNNEDVLITFARTGDIGDTGPQGAQGIQGVQGPQGPQGIQGPQSTQGTQGIQGVQGDQGPQGVQGPQSTQGTQGFLGEQGVQGISNQGIQGFEGPRGLQGFQGTQGVQGDLGLQGTQGPQGTLGIQGFQGTQGVQGDLGLQGILGIQGYQGTQGTQGTTGTDTGVPYTFSTTITDADPGSGTFRFNNSSVGSVTNVYIDNVDQLGNNQTGWYDGWDDSASTIKGQLILRSISPTITTEVIFNVTGEVTVATGYYKIPVSFVSAGGSRTNGMIFSAIFVRTGDRGLQGTQGIQGYQGVQGVQGIQGPTATVPDEITLITLSESFDNSTTDFTVLLNSSLLLNSDVQNNPARLLISLGGIIQQPETTGSPTKGFALLGGTNLSTDPLKIRFAEAPSTGQSFFGIIFRSTNSPNTAFATTTESTTNSIIFGV